MVFSSGRFSVVAEFTTFFGLRPRRFLTTGDGLSGSDASGDGDLDSGLIEPCRLSGDRRMRRSSDWPSTELESDSSSKFSVIKQHSYECSTVTERSDTI